MNKLHFGDCLDGLNELVNRFDENIDDYKSSRYDEENTKIDFIDKFFALLGWDVYNDQGFSEDLREVIREDKLVYRGMTISPDYVFRTGKERQFFVEAKKPLVNIKEGIEPAFQVRRYAYTAGLPVSILTDFEEFAVYDTRIKPNHKDKAGTARIFYCNYLEYEKNLEFLFNTFSKTAIWQGKLKRYTEDNKKKKGTQTVDKAMLVTIDGWRNELAKNIALRNKELDIYQLNEAVQKIIDRIIFLRIAEDRNTEVERSLEIVAEKLDIYNNLVKYFTASNNKYNSGLFRIVDWIDRLVIDDKIFKAIIKDLYFPSPYEFSVLPIEILGQIYEQFLGKTIRLTQGHQAKVEEKPEVRKAGGVYYTPKYIVNYIVENTVGKLLNSPLKKGARGLSPDKASNIKVLDPACGSGSFLVGAYKYLLNYHLKYYTKPKILKKALKESRIYRTGEKTYLLTIREKRNILLNNIYGVDINSQAVEVTKLSLLLTLMEGEIVEAKSELFFKQRKEALLPDLKDNIKCGNSLIGSDFYYTNQQKLNIEGKKEINWDEQRKINCFDWEVEFKEIMYGGGFDCVIGNPPYVNIRNITLTTSETVKSYFTFKYESAFKGYDLYVLFIEMSLKLLNNLGLLGFITPNKFSTLDYGEKIREILIKRYRIREIIDVSNLNVFEGASVYPYVFVIENTKIKNNKIDILICENSDNLFSKSRKKISQMDLLNNINYNISLKSSFVLNLKNQKNLNKVCKVQAGTTGFLATKTKECIIDNYHKGLDFIVTGSIDRYSIKLGNVRYINKKFTMPKLINKNNIITKGKWHLFNSEKIVIGGMTKIIEAAYDQKGYAVGVGVYCLTEFKLEPLYLLGIINSKFVTYYFKQKFEAKHLAGGYLAINVGQLNQIPIPDKAEKAQHDRMVRLVEQMLEAQKQLHSGKSKTETDKKLLQQRIDIIDKQIDALVYELYGLTEEEIRIIEEV